MVENLMREVNVPARDIDVVGYRRFLWWASMKNKYLLWLMILFGFSVFVLVSALVAHQLAYHRYGINSSRSVVAFSNFIDRQVSELTLLLDVLSNNPSITIASEPLTAFETDVTNRFLAGMVQDSPGRELLILNPDGVIVAHSAWQQKGYLLNQPFWLKESTEFDKGVSFYLDIDIASGSRRMVMVKRLFAVTLVLMVSIDELEATWRAGLDSTHMDYFISTQSGSIFFSTDYSFLFKYLDDSVEVDRGQILSYQKKLTPVVLEANQAVIQLASMPDQSLLWTTHKGLYDWSFNSLVEARDARTQAVSAAAYGGLVYIILALLFAFGRERDRRIKVLHMHNSQLETKVAVRTRELQAANVALSEEIAERIRANVALTKMQQELIQAEKLAVIGELSAGLSHELNQPITAVRSFSTNAQAFLERGKLEMVSDNLSEITRISHHMGGIVQQFKHFSRSDVVLKPVSVEQACSRAVKMLNALIEEKNIDFQMHLKFIEDTYIRGDWVLLEQILVNLITNAIDATQEQEQPTIILAGQVVDGGVSLSVTDNGGGLEPGVEEKIFQPFFTTKPQTKGLGLGLAIAQKMVELMAGTITAGNNAHLGATFNIWLPLYDRESQ